MSNESKAPELAEFLESLADIADDGRKPMKNDRRRIAASELRRQHSEIESLRAQLAARVPDAIEAIADNDAAYGYQDGWNACRAAMLSAAPSQQAPQPGAHQGA